MEARFVDRFVVDENGGGLRGEFAGEDLEQGGLTGAAGADDGEDLGGVGGEVDIFEDGVGLDGVVDAECLNLAASH